MSASQNSVGLSSGFRVLVLHSATNFDEDLNCTLASSTLGAHPPYEALSYVWGQSVGRWTVSLEGQKVGITSNLERALRHLRLPDKDRVLWVDALCIDQSNIQERNSHVEHIKDIYANCTADILWLGEDATIISEAMTMMQDFKSLIGLDDTIRKWTKEKRGGIEPEMGPLKRLFTTAEVWHRAWIMQEVAYAPRVQLVAGNVSLPWSAIEDFLGIDQYIRRFGKPDAYHARYHHEWSIRTRLNDTLTYPQILDMQRQVVRDGASYYSSQPKLIDILTRYRFTRAADPRDNIFALLGLMTTPSDVVVDYTRSVCEVYTQVTERLIEVEGSLDLLCQGPWELHGNLTRIDGLPSWVPDFSHPGKSRIIFALRDFFDTLGTDSKFNLSVTGSGILNLSGFKLATLSTVRMSYPDCYRALWKLGGKIILPPQPPLARLVLYWMPKVHRMEGVQQGNTTLEGYPSVVDDELSPLSVVEEAATTLPPSKPDQNPDYHYVPTYEAYWRTLMMDCIRKETRRIDESKDLERLRKIFSTFLTTPLTHEQRSMDNDSDVQQLVDRVCMDWDFAISNQGHYCMVPPGAKAGDQIAMVRGARTPILLRPRDDANGNEGKYEWVGACYVHDFMDGQIVKHAEATGQQESTFEVD